MNQENFKEIAKIIKPKFEMLSYESPRISQIGKDIINGLADYFEKENLQYLKRNYNDEGVKIHLKNKLFFNRQQFLKDCGLNG